MHHRYSATYFSSEEEEELLSQEEIQVAGRTSVDRSSLVWRGKRKRRLGMRKRS